MTDPENNPETVILARDGERDLHAACIPHPERTEDQDRERTRERSSVPAHTRRQRAAG